MHKNFVYLYLILITLVFSSQLFSQQPKLQYAKYDTANGFTCVDKNKNIYLGGTYYNRSNFIYSWQITKLDSNQNFLWTKNYQRYITTKGFPTSMVSDDSCNLYVTGYYTVSSSRDEAVTIKYDSSGNIKWIIAEANTGPIHEVPGKILLSSDNNLYVSGTYDNENANTDIFVIKYNLYGEKLWKKIYDTPDLSNNGNDFFTNATLDNNNSVYISFKMINGSQPSKGGILKYNPNGTLIFSNINYNYYKSSTSNLSVFNSNIYVCGILGSNDTSAVKVFLSKYDSSGANMWTKEFTKREDFNNEAYDILNDNTGIYLGILSKKATLFQPFESYVGILKYDNNGNLVWSKFKQNESTQYLAYYSILKKDPNSNIYLGGTLSYFNQKFYGYIGKFNSDGNQIWELKVNLNDTTNTGIGNLFFNNSSGVLINGGVFNTNFNSMYYAYYNQTVNLLTQTQVTPNKLDLLQNYPNPFNPSTKIKFKISQKDIYSLRLYDITGKELMNYSFNELRPGSYEFEMNMQNYASGNYFYELSSSKERIVKQLILIK